jgi:predicted transporter
MLVLGAATGLELVLVLGAATGLELGVSAAERRRCILCISHSFTECTAAVRELHPGATRNRAKVAVSHGL